MMADSVVTVVVDYSAVECAMRSDLVIKTKKENKTRFARSTQCQVVPQPQSELSLLDSCSTVTVICNDYYYLLL